MSSPLIPYLAQKYAETKWHYQAEGRRKWRLRVAEQFWSEVGPGDIDCSHTEATSVAEFDSDPDPLDGITRDVHGLGLIVRTDFSDEASWMAFFSRLQDSEKELISTGDGDDDADADATEQAPDSFTVDSQDDDSDGEDEDEDDSPASVFHIVNPSLSQERELLTNVSNLAVLRLFNDVDVRPSPLLPPATKRIHPSNRLVDCHGWQEFYRGKNVWVYDTTSNVDQCVRVVSQSGDMYGTATGDSWRARVSHICELQVNMSSGAIKIDFGGLDRWDFNERKRNMTEAERGQCISTG